MEASFMPSVDALRFASTLIYRRRRFVPAA